MTRRYGIDTSVDGNLAEPAIFIKLELFATHCAD